jgi:hypothetical protein
MSGLNVRTIQRIESGNNASLESLKSIAAVLEIDVSTLQEERLTMEKDIQGWDNLPLWLKFWFFLNFLSSKMTREVVRRIVTVAHASGFLFCVLGFVSEAALAGGLILLANGYLFSFLTLQGDKYGIWYDQ